MIDSSQISATLGIGLAALSTSNAPLFVSVIIPVWNDPERLTKCLDALRKQTYPAHSYEIIVVDNGSAVPVDHVVAPYGHARVVHEQRVGSYAARNSGLKVARGQVIAFTDADCLPAPDWIEKGVAHLKREGCMVVAGRIEIFSRSSLNPNSVELYETRVALAQKEFVKKYGFGATANLFVYKHVFERVGCFLADLKSGGDLEWCRRLNKHGLRIEYSEDIRVKHPARSSLSQLYSKIVRVAGGLHDLRRVKGSAYLEFDHRWTAELLPPVKGLARMLREPSLRRTRDRLKVCAVVIFVRYVQAFEKLRLTYPKLWNHRQSVR